MRIGIARGHLDQLLGKPSDTPPEFNDRFPIICFVELLHDGVELGLKIAVRFIYGLCACVKRPRSLARFSALLSNEMFGILSCLVLSNPVILQGPHSDGGCMPRE